MRMQVILDSLFAHPGSAPIGGGKKGEFRDWTTQSEECILILWLTVISWVSCAHKGDQSQSGF